MATNEGKTETPDNSGDERDLPTGPQDAGSSAATTGHSPQFGKVSGSAGAGGSQSSTSHGDPMKPSGLHGKPHPGMRDDGSIEGGNEDAAGTDASGNRRADSMSGVIDSGKKSPARGNSDSPDPDAGNPDSPGLDAHSKKD